ncbi:MAG: c-type cytochrome, partial [Caldilineaceae bacterium]|nr:c-type cytochrome [Caldilineaceae bacterium]
RPFGLLLLMITMAVMLAACTAGTRARMTLITGGDVARGRVLAKEYGCNSCHVIPGISGHKAWAAPPLTAWAERQYIAGSLPNTPENLIAWLSDPQAINPESAMPNLQLPEQDVLDIGAYLYTLRD